MTSHADDAPLFPSNLIPESVTASLPPGYTMRPLQPYDHKLGMLEVLKVLTSVGSISEPSFRQRYDYMKVQCPETYYMLVVLDGSGERIVGTGTVFVERKFIHDLGKVGHIEDIAVARDQQGKKLGLRIIQALDGVANNVECYKVQAFA